MKAFLQVVLVLFGLCFAFSTYAQETMDLDGKTIFAIGIPTVMVGDGMGWGGTVTLYEYWKQGSKFAPSYFLDIKYFIPEYEFNADFWTVGPGVLTKWRITDRFILNVGVAPELIFGMVSDIGLEFGLGYQGGFQYRLTPNLSLDMSVISKNILSDGELWNGITGGELGVTFWNFLDSMNKTNKFKGAIK